MERASATQASSKPNLKGHGRARGLGFRPLLKGSWDVVTRVIKKVTLLITTHKPQFRYLQPYLLSPMILQEENGILPGEGFDISAA